MLCASTGCQHPNIIDYQKAILAASLERARDIPNVTLRLKRKRSSKLQIYYHLLSDWNCSVCPIKSYIQQHISNTDIVATLLLIVNDLKAVKELSETSGRERAANMTEDAKVATGTSER